MSEPTKTGYEAFQFLERTIPIVALLLQIPILYNAPDVKWFAGFCVLFTASNVVLSKISARMPKQYEWMLELSKNTWNIVLVMVPHILYGSTVFVWTLHILSFIRIPLVFRDKRLILLNIFGLCVTPSIGLWLYGSTWGEVITPLFVLMAVGVLLPVTLNYFLHISREKEQAEFVNRSKDLFLTRLSHEFRTPLNAIIGYGELIEEEAREQDNQQLLCDLVKIKQSSHHLLSLVNNLLDLAHIEEGDILIQQETFPLKKLYDYIEQATIQQAAVNNNTFELVSELERKDLHQDYQKLCRVLLNLISNACKFTENGDISLRVWEEEEALHFAVRDTGVGIPAEKLDSIFRAFSQVDTSFTRRFDGMGVGLTLSQKLAVALGGKLSVESTIGEGTQFLFRLPVQTT